LRSVCFASVLLPTAIVAYAMEHSRTLISEGGMPSGPKVRFTVRMKLHQFNLDSFRESECDRGHKMFDYKGDILQKFMERLCDYDADQIRFVVRRSAVEDPAVIHPWHAARLVGQHGLQPLPGEDR
jgi:hypothetical protein